MIGIDINCCGYGAFLVKRKGICATRENKSSLQFDPHQCSVPPLAAGAGTGAGHVIGRWAAAIVGAAKNIAAKLESFQTARFLREAPCGALAGNRAQARGPIAAAMPYRGNGTGESKAGIGFNEALHSLRRMPMGEPGECQGGIGHAPTLAMSAMVRACFGVAFFNLPMQMPVSLKIRRDNSIDAESSPFSMALR